jgi:hypothetical protein
LLRLLGLLATLSWLTAARADDRQQTAQAESQQGPGRSPQAVVEPRPANGYWSVGKPRLFFTSRSELGAPFVKPYLSAGYGLPHWIWTGIDVNSIVTMDFYQAYVGVRAASPILDLAFGYRDTWAFGRPFLEPANHFNRQQVNDAPGPKARYWAWEAEAVGIVPLPHAAIVGDFIVIKTLDVPTGQYVYDESYRAVIANSLFYVLRVAAVARFMNENAFKLGLLTEYVFGAGRGKPVVRVGPAGSLLLTDHLELNATLTLAVSGPDNLGLALGAYGVLGLRYRWATGERDPKLPWQGELIP